MKKRCTACQGYPTCQGENSSTRVVSLPETLYKHSIRIRFWFVVNLFIIFSTFLLSLSYFEFHFIVNMDDSAFWEQKNKKCLHSDIDRSVFSRFKVVFHPEGNVWVSAVMLKTRGGRAVYKRCFPQML